MTSPEPTPFSARSKRRIALSWAVVTGLVLVGCGSTPPGPRTPTEVVRAQIAALEAGDEAGAARWLTVQAQARAPLWPDASATPSAQSAVEIGRAAAWDGAERLELVRGPAGWQIRRGVLALAHADSAERALNAFGRALVARDWAMVLDLLPAEQRAPWTAARLGDALTTGARAARWKVLGEALAAGRHTIEARDSERVRARVAVDGGPAEVVVVRDGSGWKVFDVLPRNLYIAP